MSSDVLIATKGLSKRYSGSPTLALDDLTISIGPGEVYGFLGANGAGKSTAIRTLLNFLEPTSGSATICGFDIVRDSVAVKHSIGYLAGDVALWPKVTGWELFAYLSKLQQVDTHEYLNELVKRFDAEPGKRIDQLSKGNRQKIGIIQALMHRPKVLIMDEPTSGLDPLMQEVFYDCIREASRRGVAVFVSSHNLAEAQRMCDRVGIIKHGKLIREQSIKDDLNLAMATFRVVMTSSDAAASLHSSNKLKVLTREGATVLVQPLGAMNEALKILSTFPITQLTTEQINLEDEFLEYYGDSA